MPFLSNPRTQDRIALFLLGVCVLGLLAFLHSRWTWSDWQQPIDIFGDPLEIFARVKLAEEQPLEPFTGFSQLDRLGAPFQADWSAYPAPDSVVFFLTGQLARFAGVFAAVKIVAAIFFLLCAWSFYLCARQLRWRIEWALAGALLFAFSNYNIRLAITLSFNQTFTLPPLILLCAHAVRTSLPCAGRGRWLALGIFLGAWLGLGNPYLGCFSGLLVATTCGLALVRRCPRTRVAPLAGFLITLVGVSLIANLEYILLYFTAWDQSPLARDFAGSLIYGLKPIDWLIPPPEHRLEWAAQIGRTYLRQARVLGDFFPAYLGVVGIAGLAGLLVLACKRLAQRPLRSVPDAALGLILITAYATIGGFNSLLALGGLDIFRASQRISIFVNIWALFFIMGWLQRRLLFTPRLVSMAAALTVAMAGWWEQAPNQRSAQARQSIAPKWASIQELTQQLEAGVGQGAMVFQLPVRGFPEAGPLRDMIDYEHFQPFLVNSTLHFSYGPMAHSRSYYWQQFIDHLPANEMIATLEESGFSAIWINTGAYENRGDRLVRALTANQRPEWQHGVQAPIRIVRLQPVAAAVLPNLEELRFRHAWSDQRGNSNSPLVLALHGWYPLESNGDHQWRWARKKAEIGIWCPKKVVAIRLKFQATAQRNEILELTHNGKPLLRLRLVAGENKPVDLPLTLSSGNNRLVWLYHGSPIYPPSGDDRKLGFMIQDLTVHPIVPKS